MWAVHRIYSQRQVRPPLNLAPDKRNKAETLVRLSRKNLCNCIFPPLPCVLLRGFNLTVLSGINKPFRITPFPQWDGSYHRRGNWILIIEHLFAGWQCNVNWKLLAVIIIWFSIKYKGSLFLINYRQREYYLVRL